MQERKIELGDYLLARMPMHRQPVKWWRLHKPLKSRYGNYINKRWTVNLPHFTYSRSYVGNAWLRIKLFNKWDISFSVGHYDRDEFIASGGELRGLNKRWKQ